MAWEFYVDPAALCLSSKAQSSQSAARELVGRVHFLRQAIQAGWARGSVVEETEALLFTNGGLADGQSIARTCVMTGMPVQPKDLRREINEILRVCNHINGGGTNTSMESLSAGVFDCAGQLLRVSPVEFADSLTRLVTCWWWNCRCSDEVATEAGLSGTLVSVDLPVDPCTLNFRAEVRTLADDGSTALQDESVTVPFLACQTESGSSQCVDPVTVWTTSSTDEQRAAAIRLQTHRTMAASGRGSSPSEQILAWSFIPELQETVTDLRFDRNPMLAGKLIRECAETILELASASAHPLRTGPSGNDPDIVRADGARAMRRDIDLSYHLHYWKLPNRVELAAVYDHDVYDIPGRNNYEPRPRLFRV